MASHCTLLVTACLAGQPCNRCRKSRCGVHIHEPKPLECRAQIQHPVEKLVTFVNWAARAPVRRCIVGVMTAVGERRQVAERRQRSLSAYWQGSQLVRRKAGRRTADRIYPILDWYSTRVLAAALGIMVLCCCDGVFTLQLIGHGASEANPFMAVLMMAGMGCVEQKDGRKWIGTIHCAPVS